jgi:hypothetical protein
VGEVALFPEPGKRLIVGRGEEEPQLRAQFIRQPRGELSFSRPLNRLGLSRRQAMERRIPIGLEIDQLGQCRTFVNAVETGGCVLMPGDTLMFGNELLLVCLAQRRQGVRMEARTRFGEPDASGIVVQVRTA